MKKENNTNLVKRLICLPIGCLMAVGSVHAASLETRVAELEKLLGEQAEKQAKSEKRGITLYGSFRPALTVSDSGDSTSTDVTDFLSRIGLKGEEKVSDDLTVVYRGEWKVDIQDGGDFGDVRLAYVGLKGDFGQVAIGQQWNPHFNLVAEVTDLYNHRSSPFAYDAASPFRTDQMVTYSYSSGGFKLDAGLQVNGDNGADTNHFDSGSVGVGYNFGSAYVGVSYLKQNENADFEERTFSGVGASWNATDDLYLAITYQDISRDEAVNDYDQTSVDLAASYALGHGYKVKASYFDWDADGQSDSFDGYNLTLERQINDRLRVFGEWLSRDIEGADTQDSLSVGIRYDFETTI